MYYINIYSIAKHFFQPKIRSGLSQVRHPILTLINATGEWILSKTSTIITRTICQRGDYNIITTQTPMVVATKNRSNISSADNFSLYSRRSQLMRTLVTYKHSKNALLCFILFIFMLVISFLNSRWFCITVILFILYYTVKIKLKI